MFQEGFPIKESKQHNVSFLFFKGMILKHLFHFFQIIQLKWMCLNVACITGHLPIDQYLIEKCADIEAKDSMEQKAPLHVACEKGNIPIVELFIEKALIMKQTI